MKKALSILSVISLVAGIFCFVPEREARAENKVNCTGFDGYTHFVCYDGIDKVCASIIMDDEVVECKGAKRAQISPAIPED